MEPGEIRPAFCELSAPVTGRLLVVFVMAVLATAPGSSHAFFCLMAASEMSKRLQRPMPVMVYPPASRPLPAIMPTTRQSGTAPGKGRSEAFNRPPAARWRPVD
jgi:hypothetical protein